MVALITRRGFRHGGGVEETSFRFARRNEPNCVCPQEESYFWRGNCRPEGAERHKLQKHVFHAESI